MKFYIQVISSFILILISSCTDKCSDINCQNGGTCDEGICQCDAAYIGNECEISKIDHFSSNLWKISMFKENGIDQLEAVKDFCIEVEKIDELKLFWIAYKCNESDTKDTTYFKFKEDFSKLVSYNPDTGEENTSECLTMMIKEFTMNHISLYSKCDDITDEMTIYPVN